MDNNSTKPAEEASATPPTTALPDNYAEIKKKKPAKLPVIIAAVALLVIGGVAVTAYQIKNQPQNVIATAFDKAYKNPKPQVGVKIKLKTKEILSNAESSLDEKGKELARRIVGDSEFVTLGYGLDIDKKDARGVFEFNNKQEIDVKLQAFVDYDKNLKTYFKIKADDKIKGLATDALGYYVGQALSPYGQLDDETNAEFKNQIDAYYKTLNDRWIVMDQNLDDETNECLDAVRKIDGKTFADYDFKKVFKENDPFEIVDTKTEDGAFVYDVKIDQDKLKQLQKETTDREPIKQAMDKCRQAAKTDQKSSSSKVPEPVDLISDQHKIVVDKKTRALKRIEINLKSDSKDENIKSMMKFIYPVIIIDFEYAAPTDQVKDPITIEQLSKEIDALGQEDDEDEDFYENEAEEFIFR